MAGIKGTRVDYEVEPMRVGKKSLKADQRVNDQNEGGGLAGTERARAQKPVGGVTNANTVSTSDSEKVARPTTGGRK